MASYQQARAIQQLSNGSATSDGAGVKMTRLIADQSVDMLDPFLLLDHFKSDNPNDYLGGFPSHPHRGFETVTYMLTGKMRHKDSAGNEGVIGPYGVQWMTAGRGIIHSEMPEQEQGLMSGFQLWVNLPASAKMTDPAYQEFSAAELQLETLPSGGTIRVIAGESDAGTKGLVINNYVKPLYMHITLPAGSEFKQQLSPTHNALMYVISGSLLLSADTQPITGGQLVVLASNPESDHVAVWAEANGCDFLLIAGQPLNEPIARHGPFVMNTQQEILQAIDDFNNQRLIS